MIGEQGLDAQTVNSVAEDRTSGQVAIACRRSHGRTDLLLAVDQVSSVASRSMHDLLRRSLDGQRGRCHEQSFRGERRIVIDLVRTSRPQSASETCAPAGSSVLLPATGAFSPNGRHRACRTSAVELAGRDTFRSSSVERSLEQQVAEREGEHLPAGSKPRVSTVCQ